MPVPRLLLILLLWLIAHVMLSAAFMAPGVHATNAPPPARALIVIQFSAAIFYAGIGYLLGAILRQQLRHQARWRFVGVGVTLILLLIAPLATVVSFNQVAQVYAQYAREWDRDDALLRAADGSAVSLPPYTVDVAQGLGLDSLTGDAASWVNRCVAEYYDVAAVTVAQQP